MPSFNELLKAATPGPFAVQTCPQYDEDSYPLTKLVSLTAKDAGGGQYVVCDNRDYYPQAVSATDQELICRLLNFAHAGGFGILQEILDLEFGIIPSKAECCDRLRDRMINHLKMKDNNRA